MFSDHLRRIGDAPVKPLLLFGAGLLIACQLVAMVLVANGQVEKAYLREVSQASTRAATAWCVESSHGTALRECGKVSVPDSARAAGSETPAPKGFTVVTFGNRL